MQGLKEIEADTRTSSLSLSLSLSLSAVIPAQAGISASFSERNAGRDVLRPAANAMDDKSRSLVAACVGAGLRRHDGVGGAGGAHSGHHTFSGRSGSRDGQESLSRAGSVKAHKSHRRSKSRREWKRRYSPAAGLRIGASLRPRRDGKPPDTSKQRGDQRATFRTIGRSPLREARAASARQCSPITLPRFWPRSRAAC